MISGSFTNDPVLSDDHQTLVLLIFFITENQKIILFSLDISVLFQYKYQKILILWKNNDLRFKVLFSEKFIKMKWVYA